MRARFPKILIIPLLITVTFFIFQAFPWFTKFSVFSVIEEGNVNFLTPEKLGKPILSNEKFSGTFKATDNNLGVMLMRTLFFSGGPKDVTFRIKEKGDKDWHSENKYTGLQFWNKDYFPFGFPPFYSSKNNSYVFEIESTSSEGPNGIGINSEYPQAFLVYKYSIGEFKDPKIFFSFILKKPIYVLKNINYLLLIEIFVISILLALFIKEGKITIPAIIRFLWSLVKNPRKTLKSTNREIRPFYLSLEKKIINYSIKLGRKLISNEFYSPIINTDAKRRLLIGLLIFILAITYRFSSSLVNLDKLFYAELGGGGDYDQFIRAATCALNFCSWIIHQNLLIESSILGIFYEIFGFTGGLKAYLYLMIILSSIVATLPYLLLSRKSWITIGGIIGSLYLATSDFLTQIALSFPPDNGSLFSFSMFYIVYLLTLHIGSIRWLLFFGLMGIIDGLNKALFLINDLVAFMLFIPVFFFEKIKSVKVGSILRKKNIKILLLSLIPVIVFLVIYTAWEYFVYIKFIAPYFLRGLLLSGGESYIIYTSFSDKSLESDILVQIFYLCASGVVMIKRLIIHAGFRIMLLAPILLGLLFFTFLPIQGKKFPIRKFALTFFLSVALVGLLVSIKNNYLGVHEVFPVEYIVDAWTSNIYINIFILTEIILLFILNFKYSALKLALPIIPYVVMLIILTKNSPFARLHTHVIVWSVILFAYIIDYIIRNIDKYSKARVVIVGPILLILFVQVFTLPKLSTMIKYLNSGSISVQNQVRYLKWVEENVPANTIILAGDKSDLVTVAENIRRPIIFNALWRGALLIKPKEIPGVSPTDFSMMSELKNKDNFKKRKYIILEDDIDKWRGRLAGLADSVFSTTPDSLHAEDYSIKVYKFNPALRKTIYELVTLDN